MQRTTASLILLLGLLGTACDKAPAKNDATAKADTKAKAGDAKAKTDDAKAKAGDAKAGDAKAGDAKAGDAKADGTPVHINLDEEGRALRGYDALTYHTDGKPVEGKAEHAFEWNGGKWLFASAENREKFSASPERYAPANGGYCTFGVVLGKKFDGDPNVWFVKDDSLYVFLNEEVKAKFLEDEAGNLGKVNANWPTIEKRAPADLEG